MRRFFPTLSRISFCTADSWFMPLAFDKFASCPAGSAKPVAYAHDYDETMPMEEQSIPPAAEFSMAMQISSEEEPLEQSPGGPSQVGTDWFKTSHP